ncbi:SDR family NAD(P)-dependent oxidoreductase [Legionella oakridgensis]|uniref:Short-chain dehydrogenase of various substrate specificities n=2 Tax=Legionella oakridgensis TaxID=29423 RepID=W0BG64_9GAMM|nr:SDR family NAD(P)-dependent oxidoreductase [Legionella oakridgensis]AHE67424.1 short-chain dehydrogenase of various substrate specificities [Legionella oakridgensis ATCC 33761 = DSM 21215]ETO92956.1 short-chain dehydrogenase of various substrate specificities [Legionella oakridgensis RV-2-2007]KTD43484.1 oxidoreductase dehydrogenase, short chain [Legionella oakridgensis]STY20476.1 oxidoreductase dehydrogenase, short chain [Legionella longbeachae]
MNENKQIAVITGAADGIGLALAKICLQRQMQVVMADNAKDDLQARVNELSQQAATEVLGIVCDVSREEEVRRLADHSMGHFGRIDLLINNAGISGRLAPVWKLSAAEIRQVFDVNVFGVIHGVQAFLPYMLKQQHSSHIVNMASFYGLCSGSNMSAYAMSKHAIVSLSESLYFELQPLNPSIHVSVVCPSFVNTNLLINSFSANAEPIHKKVMELMGRGRPTEDVAQHIMHEINKKTFYILPDKEVKEYCVQRTQAIIEQTMPNEYAMEKIMRALSRRHPS